MASDLSPVVAPGTTISCAGRRGDAELRTARIRARDYLPQLGHRLEEIEKATLYCLGPKYSAYGLLRSGDLTSPMSPLRCGEVSGAGLNYDYSAYGVEEAFRRGDLAMIELVKAAERVRETYPLD